MHEEIGVVPPVSDTALVLDYLNGPLPTLCALALGDLGLSILSSLQSEVFQYISEEMPSKLKHFFPVSMKMLQFCIVGMCVK